MTADRNYDPYGYGMVNLDGTPARGARGASPEPTDEGAAERPDDSESSTPEAPQAAVGDEEDILFGDAAPSEDEAESVEAFREVDLDAAEDSDPSDLDDLLDSGGGMSRVLEDDGHESSIDLSPREGARARIGSDEGVDDLDDDLLASTALPQRARDDFADGPDDERAFDGAAAAAQPAPAAPQPTAPQVDEESGAGAEFDPDDDDFDPIEAMDTARPRRRRHPASVEPLAEEPDFAAGEVVEPVAAEPVRAPYDPVPAEPVARPAAVEPSGYDADDGYDPVAEFEQPRSAEPPVEEPLTPRRRRSYAAVGADGDYDAARTQRMTTLQKKVQQQIRTRRTGGMAWLFAVLVLTAGAAGGTYFILLGQSLVIGCVLAGLGLFGALFSFVLLR